ncbi:phage tail spike protein [Actinomyces faecalis]|uniref:phage tail spike protein n=1 Tax=Actinomyces faecalis TaxID=2722820 RepID=UPI001F19E397|nr:phage tail spike protein [Actinomyces faecalis]
MITLHDPSLQQGDTFTTSSRMVLDPHLASAKVSEEINGAFTLSLSWPLGELGMVAEGDIVAAPVPGMARQGFRITTLEATSDQLMTATCTHITGDLSTNVIVDKAAVNRTATEALAYLLASLSAPHPFTAGPTTSIGYRTTARWVRKTGLEALVDDEVGLLSRWGGEIIRDNTRITWVSARGRDRGASVWEGKNLTGLTVTIDTTSLATRILPVGFDGLTLPEVFIDSPRLGDYTHPYIRVVSFDQVRPPRIRPSPARVSSPWMRHSPRYVTQPVHCLASSMSTSQPSSLRLRWLPTRWAWSSDWGPGDGACRLLPAAGQCPYHRLHLQPTCRGV